MAIWLAACLQPTIKVQNLLTKTENRTSRVKSLSVFRNHSINECRAWNEIITYVYIRQLFFFKHRCASHLAHQILKVLPWLWKEREGISSAFSCIKTLNSVHRCLELVLWKLLESRLEKHMWVISMRCYGHDILNQQRKSINSIISSSSGAQHIIIYVPNQTKQNLFTLLALGRAWLPTRRALLKVTVVRTLPGARPTVELAQPSVSEQVRTPPPTKPRNYRNLPTACKLLLLVCDSHPASDLLSHLIRPSLRHWDWCLRHWDWCDIVGKTSISATVFVLMETVLLISRLGQHNNNNNTVFISEYCFSHVWLCSNKNSSRGDMSTFASLIVTEHT